MRSRNELAFLLAVVTLELLPVLVFSRSTVVAVAMATLAFATVLLALWATAGGLTPDRPSAVDRALAPVRVRPARPSDLERIERDVELAEASGRIYDERLRPLLRTAAALRLAERRGIDLEGQPAAARAALGEELWEAIGDPAPRTLAGRSPGRRLGPLVEAVEDL